MKLNKGEKLAIEVLHKLGFGQPKKQRFVDFSAIHHGKRVQIEVKYRRRIGNSCKVTKRQLEEADFLLIVNEKEYRLVEMSNVKKREEAEKPPGQKRISDYLTQETL